MLKFGYVFIGHAGCVYGIAHYNARNAGPAVAFKKAPVLQKTPIVEVHHRYNGHLLIDSQLKSPIFKGFQTAGIANGAFWINNQADVLVYFFTAIGIGFVCIGVFSSVYRYVEVHKKVFKKRNFEQLVFAHKYGGMIHVKRAENNIEVRGVIGSNNAGPGQVVFLRGVSNAWVKKRAEGNDTGPEALQPEYKIKMFGTQCHIKKGEQEQEGNGKPQGKPDLPERHQYQADKFHDVVESVMVR